MRITTAEQANSLSRHAYSCLKFCIICRNKLKTEQKFRREKGSQNILPDYKKCILPNETFKENFFKCYNKHFIEQDPQKFPSLVCNGCVESIRQCAKGKRPNPPLFTGFYSEDQEFNKKTRHFSNHCLGTESDDYSYSCSICRKASEDIIESQGAAEPPAKKQCTSVRICGQPYGQNNDRCQVLIGKGRRTSIHTCGPVANTHQLVSMANKAGVTDQVCVTLYRQKEAILKKLKRTKNHKDLTINFKNLHGKNTILGRFRSTKRIENNKNKKVTINDLINIQRTQFAPDNKIESLVSTIKKANGCVDDYAKYKLHMRSLLPNCHDTHFTWLPVTITQSQNDIGNLIKKYQIDDTTSEDEYIPNKSLRDVKFNSKLKKYEAERYCAVAYVSDFSHFLDQVKYYRDLEDDNILIKLQADGGGGTTKLACQIHKKENLSKTNYVPNSLTTLFVLAETYADESSDVMKIMWELLELDKLFDIYKTVWVSDLKLMSILMGLSKGNCKFFCPKCEKDAFDKKPFEAAKMRELSEWKTRVANIKNFKQPKDNFSIEKPPISWKLLQSTYQIIPPELHICEGVINKTHSFLKDKGETDLLATWEGSIHAKGYSGGKFTGNLCRQLLAKRHILEDKFPDIKFMLDIFYDLTHHLFSCGPITHEELDNFQDLVDLFAKAYERTGISVTHKVHWLIFHVIDTMRYWKVKLGSLSEQDGESLHHFFERYRVYSSDKENHFTGPIEKWNRERLNPNPKIKAKTKGEDDEFNIEQVVNAYGIALL